jgi:hypothetical protein
MAWPLLLSREAVAQKSNVGATLARDVRFAIETALETAFEVPSEVENLPRRGADPALKQSDSDPVRLSNPAEAC